MNLYSISDIIDDKLNKIYNNKIKNLTVSATVYQVRRSIIFMKWYQKIQKTYITPQ